MLEALKRHLAHDRWANGRVLALLERHPDPEALRLLAHVLAAQRVWLLRLRGEDATIAVWPELGVEECRALMEENASAYAGLLSGLTPEGLERAVAYRNSRGEPFSTGVADVLLHVFAHGSYHRGQVALVLRRSGVDPVNTDYITFVREAPP